MKSLGWILPVGVIGYLIYQAQLTSNTIGQLSYMIFGIKFNKANSNLFQSQLLVKLRVNNPSFNSVSFNNFSYNLTIQGHQLASGNYKPGSGITIATGNTDIEFPVNVSNLSVALQLKAILAQWLAGNFNQQIRIVGALAAGGLTVPIDQTLTLSSIGSLGRINGAPQQAETIYLDY